MELGPGNADAGLAPLQDRLERRAQSLGVDHPPSRAEHFEHRLHLGERRVLERALPLAPAPRFEFAAAAGAAPGQQGTRFGEDILAALVVVRPAPFFGGALRALAVEGFGRRAAPSGRAFDTVKKLRMSQFFCLFAGSIWQRNGRRGLRRRAARARFAD